MPTLLGRLSLEADVHVLLSMRDDFLFHCPRPRPPSRPVLSELTLLRSSYRLRRLRRAVVQPALKCGYRFEEERAGGRAARWRWSDERGALPTAWPLRLRGYGTAGIGSRGC